jgi:hypothetical protein
MSTARATTTRIDDHPAIRVASTLRASAAIPPATTRTPLRPPVAFGAGVVLVTSAVSSEAMM